LKTILAVSECAQQGSMALHDDTNNNGDGQNDGGDDDQGDFIKARPVGLLSPPDISYALQTHSIAPLTPWVD
jgi:hypothetical protein